MTEFRNEILAGTVLARVAMRSENFVSGSTGWQIQRDGTAEFNNLIARGTLQSANFVQGSTGWRIQNTGEAEFNDADIRGDVIVGDPTDTHIAITQDEVIPNTGASNIRFISGQSEEIEPAHLENQYAGGSGERSHFFMRGADIASGHGHPLIDIHTGRPDGTLGHDIQLLGSFGGSHPAGSRINLNADSIDIDGPLEANDGIESLTMRPRRNEDATHEIVSGVSYGIENNPAQLVFTTGSSGIASLTLDAWIAVETDPVANIVATIYVSFQIRQGSSIGSGMVIIDSADNRAVKVQKIGAGSGGSQGIAIQTSGTFLFETSLSPNTTYNVRTSNRITVLNGNESDVNNRQVFFRSVFVRPEM